MPIQAKQEIDTNWDYEVISVETPHPITGEKSGVFMNIRTDDNTILGTTTDRYGLFQNKDLIGRADNQLTSRDIEFERRIIISDEGRKMRTIYDLQGDQFQLDVPQVGDAMGAQLILQNSFDRTLRISYALGLLRLICTNGMKTMEREVSMVKKHSRSTNLDELLSDNAVDQALAKIKNSADVYSRLASVELSQEQGLIVLQNLANSKVFSEKVREAVSLIWNSPDFEEDESRNLYNLNNAVTQHATHALEQDSFQYADRIRDAVLKKFNRASLNVGAAKKLWTPAKGEEITVTE